MTADDSKKETVTVYWLYNRNNGEHFYTFKEEEKYYLSELG